jgi:DNA-binding transcriptional LysR family regulator
MGLGPNTADIPLELLRTFVAVSKTSTLAQAARSLGLAPSLVDAQMTQLEQTLGAEVLERSATGVRLSDYGKVVTSYAERMLAMNDQVVSQSRLPLLLHRIRAGLPRWVQKTHLVEIVRRCTADVGKDRVSLRCDHLEHLMRDLSAGLLDLALLCNVTDPPGVMVREWWEDMYWVKSPELTLTPGAPVPIVSGPGSMSDRLVNQTLGAAGIDYVVAFTAADLSARVAAVAAGLGVMAVPERVTGHDVHIAREDFLPPLPQTRKGLYVRGDLDVAAVEPVLRVLESCIRPPSSNVVTALFGGRRAQNHPAL